MKKVLVTGAKGFIGRFVIPLLHNRGYEIHSIGRSTVEQPNVLHHTVDLLDSPRTIEIIRSIKPTHLLHLAWIATPGVYQTSPENAQWLTASQQLFDACIASGCTRIVGAGSSFEYEWKRGALREDDPLVPSTPYGQCKRDCGLWLQSNTNASCASAAWGRIFFLFGPYENPRRLVSSVIRSLLLGEEARSTIGTQVRDFLPVEDVAAAFVTLLESKVTGAVNIASGRGITVAELVTQIATLIGRPDLLRLGAIPLPSAEPPEIVADITRLRDDVGFHPSRTLHTALRETIQWWAEELAVAVPPSIGSVR